MNIFDLVAYSNRVGIVVSCNEVPIVSAIGFDHDDLFLLEVPRRNRIECRSLACIAAAYELTHLSRTTHGIQDRVNSYLTPRGCLYNRRSRVVELNDIKTLIIYASIANIRDIYLNSDSELMDLKGESTSMEEYSSELTE